MSTPQRLNDQELSVLLGRHPHWTREDDAIKRDFKFADFAQAFAFMTRVAIAAEKLNHHPEWSNVYNRVSVRLTTHDAGGLSALDFQLARLMDEFVA